MESLDGIAELHMSGARAVFELEPDALFTKSVVAAAIKEQGLTLVSLEAMPQRDVGQMYLVDAGVT